MYNYKKIANRSSTPNGLIRSIRTIANNTLRMALCRRLAETVLAESGFSNQSADALTCAIFRNQDIFIFDGLTLRKPGDWSQHVLTANQCLPNSNETSDTPLSANFDSNKSYRTSIFQLQIIRAILDLIVFVSQGLIVVSENTTDNGESSYSRVARDNYEKTLAVILDIQGKIRAGNTPVQALWDLIAEEGRKLGGISSIDSAIFTRGERSESSVWPIRRQAQEYICLSDQAQLPKTELAVNNLRVKSLTNTSTTDKFSSLDPEYVVPDVSSEYRAVIQPSGQIEYQRRRNPIGKLRALFRLNVTDMINHYYQSNVWSTLSPDEEAVLFSDRKEITIGVYRPARETEVVHWKHQFVAIPELQQCTAIPLNISELTHANLLHAKRQMAEADDNPLHVTSVDQPVREVNSEFVVIIGNDGSANYFRKVLKNIERSRPVAVFFTAMLKKALHTDDQGIDAIFEKARLTLERVEISDLSSEKGKYIPLIPEQYAVTLGTYSSEKAEEIEKKKKTGLFLEWIMRLIYDVPFYTSNHPSGLTAGVIGSMLVDSAPRVVNVSDSAPGAVNRLITSIVGTDRFHCYGITTVDPKDGSITTIGAFQTSFIGVNPQDLTSDQARLLKLKESLGNIFASIIADTIFVDGLRSAGVRAIHALFGTQRGNYLMRIGQELPKPEMLQKPCFMFVDLVESSPMAEALSPEEFADVFNRYYTAIFPIVEAQNGVIDNIIGDGIFVVYGYSFQEFADDGDKATSSIRTAINLQRAVDKLNRTDPLISRLIYENKIRPIRIRIGIHQADGEVWSGQVGPAWMSRHTCLGKDPALAARIEAKGIVGGNLASAGTIASMSQDARQAVVRELNNYLSAFLLLAHIPEFQLTEDKIFSPQTPIQAKGFANNVEVSRVTWDMQNTAYNLLLAQTLHLKAIRLEEVISADNNAMLIGISIRIRDNATEGESVVNVILSVLANNLANLGLEQIVDLNKIRNLVTREYERVSFQLSNAGNN